MKRWILFLPLLLLLLTGCDRRQQVGICWRDCDDPLSAQYRQTVESVFSEEKYALTVLDASNDQSKQNMQVADLLHKKIDILILEPVMTTAQEEVLQQAREANVPVVFVSREPDEKLLESWDKACYVGADTTCSGMLQAQLLSSLPAAGDINGDGCVSYAVLAGPEDHLDARLRTDGCINALEQADLNTECLSLEYGLWSREDGFKRCAQLLSQYGKDVEVIFCNSDELALGAIDAIKDGGRTVGENLYLFGIDGQRQTLFLIRSGDLTGTVHLDVSQQAQSVLAAAEALLNGKTPPKNSYIDYIPVNIENVEDYIED